MITDDPDGTKGSPFTDILKAHNIPQHVVHDFSMPGTARTYDNLKSCEQALLQIVAETLEAVYWKLNSTNNHTPDYYLGVDRTITEIKARLGINGEGKPQ